jgi:hypothetical protein
MLPRPAAKPEASGSSRGPAQRAADRAVLVHPVRHHDGEHLGRLVVAGRQLDVVRLTDLAVAWEKPALRSGGLPARGSKPFPAIMKSGQPTA